MRVSQSIAGKTKESGLMGLDILASIRRGVFWKYVFFVGLHDLVVRVAADLSTQPASSVK